MTGVGLRVIVTGVVRDVAVTVVPVHGGVEIVVVMVRGVVVVVVVMAILVVVLMPVELVPGIHWKYPVRSSQLEVIVTRQCGLFTWTDYC